MATLRIREFREKSELTLEQLSGETGISVSQLSRIERGERTARSDEMERIAATLGTAPGRLFQSTESAPLVGFVGAGAEAHYYAAGQGPFELVAAPEGSTDKTVAVEIRGESLGALFDRWLVFYDDVRTPVTEDLIGQLCVVGLPDDRVLVKKLKPSRSRGLFHLLSNTEEPILDVAVSWAARVRNMTPR